MLKIKEIGPIGYGISANFNDAREQAKRQIEAHQAGYVDLVEIDDDDQVISTRRMFRSEAERLVAAQAV